MPCYPRQPLIQITVFLLFFINFCLVQCLKILLTEAFNLLILTHFFFLLTWPNAMWLLSSIVHHKLFTFKYSPLIALCKIKPNLARMALRWSPYKIMLYRPPPPLYSRWLPGLKIELYWIDHFVLFNVKMTSN